jgi:catechol-2,3-dioxygenase
VEVGRSTKNVVARKGAASCTDNKKLAGKMINGINHITISVKNIDTAFSFYKDVLKLKPVMKSNRSAYFYAGNIWVALDQREPYNTSQNYAHICFNVPKKYFNEFVDEIRKNNIQEWQKNETDCKVNAAALSSM